MAIARSAIQTEDDDEADGGGHDTRTNLLENSSFLQLTHRWLTGWLANAAEEQSKPQSVPLRPFPQGLVVVVVATTYATCCKIGWCGVCGSIVVLLLH